MVRSRAEEQTASFMALCLGDFSSKLWIPAKFVRKYRQVAQQASVMVECDDGRYWEVKIKYMNGDLYMKDGWSEVVKDNHISELDFLTFRLLDDSTFKVSIYTADGCPRHPTFPTSSSAAGRNDTTSTKKRRRWEAGEEEESDPHYFEVTLKKHHISRFNLPKNFSNVAGVGGKKYVRVECEGNCKSVRVDPRPCSRMDLTWGWREFREANGLDIGKTCSFRFIPDDNVIRVREIKKPKPRESSI